MTISRLGTSGAGMVFVETKAMVSAVKDLGAVIGSGHAGCGNGSQGGRSWGRASGEHGCHVGAVESSLAGGEALKAFFVCCCEGRLELSVCAVGSGPGEPVVTYMGKHTSGFKEEVCEVNGSGIRDGVVAIHSNVANFMEMFPQQFDWLGWVP